MKLSIIILSYNTSVLLDQTIGSIRRKSEYEVIVVDNASTDNSVAMVKKKYPWVKVLKNSTNLGFAKANNQALKIAKGEYVMLLNSDVVVREDAIDVLMQYLSTRKKVGIVTPRVVLPDGSLDRACHRGMPTPWNAFTYFSGLEKIFPHSKAFGGYHQGYLNLKQAHPVDATSATAMIVKKEAIDKVGGLDEQFFFYAEDLDWCIRMREAGYEIHFVPEAKVLHYKSQSGKGKKQDPEQQKASQLAFYDTMKQFYRKHYVKKYPQVVTRLVFWAIDFKKWWATK